MKGYPSPLRRAWNARPWSANPLLRASYRIESMLGALAIMLILLSIPVAATIGTSTYVTRSAEIEQLAGSIRSIDASLDEDAFSKTATVSGAVVVQAHWTVDGREHTGDVVTGRLAKSGDRIPVWILPNGEQTGPPPKSSQAVADAVGVTVLVISGVTAAMLAPLWLLRTALDRRRRDRWRQEWAALAGSPKWTHL